MALVVMFAQVAKFVDAFFTSGSSSSTFPSMPAGRGGHVSSGSQRKWGPLSRRLSSRNDSTDNPRDASLAGLDFVSTYLHWIGEDASLMVAILFATKV